MVFSVKTMSYEFDLSLCKEIDQYEKDTVFGYIRLQTKELDFKHNIPSLILHACLLYYHEYACFDIDKCGEGMELTDNNRKVTMIKDFPS